ncbi:uncharacterized protein [Rutidosis leptorrhynchoides]|uniref:uncharacterized protein n=1 Tax=Rutidosis leptorrhynchoides TaxID=125765 RepID=UPI003A9974B2
MSFNIRGFGSGKDSKIRNCRKLLCRESPFIVALQETKCNIVDSNWISLIWGSHEFGFVQKEKSFVSDFFIAVMGRWKGRDELSIIVNIYGPHEDSNKVKMWASLENFLGDYDAAWVLCRDFNELKFSKLDRFLISEKFNSMWGDVSALALERTMSDHFPIVLRDRVIDFGPKATKIFDEWLEFDGKEHVVKEAWNINVDGRRSDCIFRNKLKNVKFDLKEWSQKTFGKIDLEIEEAKKESN